MDKLRGPQDCKEFLRGSVDQVSEVSMTYGACLRVMLFVTGLSHPPPRHSSDLLTVLFMESSPRARQPQFDPLGKRTLVGVGEITRLFFLHPH